MKLLPPMSVMHYDAIVKLVNAGAQAAGLQAHVEIGLAGAVLSAVQDVPDPEDTPKIEQQVENPVKPKGQQSRAPQRKRRKG